MSIDPVESKIRLSEFIKYIDEGLYVELYVGDTSISGLVYEGVISDLINDEEKYQDYLILSVQPQGLSIDSSGVLYILIDSE